MRRIQGSLKGGLYPLEGWEPQEFSWKFAYFLLATIVAKILENIEKYSYGANILEKSETKSEN